MNAVILFHTGAQLKGLLQWAGKNQVSTQWLAMTPEADYAADRLGVPYKTIEDVYSEDELCQLGKDNFSRLEDLCKEFDHWVREACGPASGLRSFSAWNYAFSFKRLLDALLRESYTLKNAFRKLSPDLVVSTPPHHTSAPDHSFFALPSLPGEVLPIVTNHLKLKLVRWEPDKSARLRFPTTDPPVPMRERLQQAIRSLPGSRHLSALYRLLQRRTWNRYSPDVPNVLITGTVEAKLVEAFVRKGWRVIDILSVFSGRTPTLSDFGSEASVGGTELDRLWQLITNSASFRALFVFHGIDLFSAVKERFRNFVFRIIPEHRSFELVFENSFREKPIALVFGSSPVLPRSVACFCAARKACIPSVVHQHGAYFDNPIIMYLDGKLPDYFFCYGQAVADFAQRYASRWTDGNPISPAKPVPVGSSSLDTFLKRKQRSTSRLKRNKTKRRVMYIATALMGYARYFPYHQPDIWYWNLRKRIISVCCSFSNIELVLKTHPGDFTFDPTYTWIQEHQFANITILRDLRLTDYIQAADLFIIDFLSTTLLQILTTDKKIIAFCHPLLLLMPRHAIGLLKKRVVFLSDETTFLNSVASTLHEADWSIPQPPNDEFLRDYGVYLNDGHSAARTVAAIEEIFRGDSHAAP